MRGKTLGDHHTFRRQTTLTKTPKRKSGKSTRRLPNTEPPKRRVRQSTTNRRLSRSPYSVGGSPKKSPYPVGASPKKGTRRNPYNGNWRESLMANRQKRKVKRKEIKETRTSIYPPAARPPGSPPCRRLNSIEAHLKRQNSFKKLNGLRGPKFALPTSPSRQSSCSTNRDPYAPQPGPKVMRQSSLRTRRNQLPKLEREKTMAVDDDAMIIDDNGTTTTEFLSETISKKPSSKPVQVTTQGEYLRRSSQQDLTRQGHRRKDSLVTRGCKCCGWVYSVPANWELRINSKCLSCGSFLYDNVTRNERYLAKCKMRAVGLAFRFIFRMKQAMKRRRARLAALDPIAQKKKALEEALTDMF